jgi:hypothetical protein
VYSGGNVIKLQKNNIMNDEHEIIRLARPVDESDHTLGLKSAAATLVEYGDFEGCVAAIDSQAIIGPPVRLSLSGNPARETHFISL